MIGALYYKKYVEEIQEYYIFVLKVLEIALKQTFFALFFPIFSALWTLDQLAVYTFFFHGLVQLDLLIDPHFWNSVRSLH